MKPFPEDDETVQKQKASYPRYQQNGDGQHAIHLRYDLKPVTQQFPRWTRTAPVRPQGATPCEQKVILWRNAIERWPSPADYLLR